MRIRLSVASALLFAVSASAEDTQANVAVPLQDGDVIRAICETEENSAGFYRQNGQAESWQNLNTRLDSDSPTMPVKYDVIVSKKSATATMRGPRGTLPMECEFRRGRFLFLDQVGKLPKKERPVSTLSCSALGLEIVVNLDTRRMVETSLDGYLSNNANQQVFDGNWLVPCAYISLGTCTIIDGSQHLEAPQKTKIPIIRD